MEQGADMDAQMLFREGITALRDKHDPLQARQLIQQSLKLNPENDMAWLWLSRTTDDPQKQLRCIERALKVNPTNAQALTLRAKLLIAAQSQVNANLDWRARLEVVNTPMLISDEAQADPIPEPAQTRTPLTPSPADQQQIARILTRADQLLAQNDVEGALENWVQVLDLQADHPLAMQKAVRYLFKLNYRDDARELIWRALEAGTTSLPIHMTAIDIARHQGDHVEADDLREKVILLPNADDDLISKMIDVFLDDGQPQRAAELLERVVALRPDSQKLLLKLGEIYEQKLGRKAESMLYYERAARLKTHSKEGKDAEQVLRNFTPIVTDRERGSIPLALREALGFGAVFLLLGWQDAGLNLLNMGSERWLGVGLSILGGYLLVTALSSPQQKPVAAWLGGHVPENRPAPPAPKQQVLYQDDMLASGAVQEPTHIPIIPPALRVLITLVGTIVLIGAFILVFSMSIQLLRSPVAPFVPSINDLLTETAP